MIKEKANKISIIGAGFVGSTTAYSLMIQGLASDIVIVDINKDKAEAEAMDLSHGAAFVKAVDIKAGTYEDTKNSDIIIITAGIGPKPGETRLDIINKNLAIFKEIVPEVVKYSPNSILLVVSNPVDILTYITYKLSGFPKNRVIGSGTVLDTSRLKYMLSEHFDIDARNVHTYIIGEHGDSEITAWSLTNIAGMNADSYCQNVCSKCDKNFKYEIPNLVKNAAYEIINRKGYTNYAVALAVTRIVEAILRDEDSILTVSSLFQGQYGINDVYLAIPTILNRNGAKKILEVPLSTDEISKLKESSDLLISHLSKAKF
ncbi:L-lactate dehydrogenase [Clostridium chauvoei]|uniref:L-lactate dehydrogenase n=2 Tax=Clostridium chauvoei TaxID=46867 RepID=S6EKQ1_9CLOT|nr:L-lactate dehydrogenase [Clostridium chauvoei]ATD55143.1 L-lactate dehydrogenase [Clostridium chauvoei]ATD57184.1 L-lactate dehydrogenase [Clostridium chauvoei]MBX7279489.1 L-lactate dehydrogenase [Clostridium chauvoei]MBX7282425.1 L-lactate dehydrogenase [Clostridium chauvoei]MBX7285688.1 L-lactate dehydrogenase [Clostridium chauvoei]